MDISSNYTVISTFAGTGGSSLGYKWAGFKELLAIDFDSHAVECFRLNFPDVIIWHRDIKTVSVQEIFDFCKIQSGDLDIFDGSPPCQGFSTSGKRQVNDDRNDLFKEYVRLIEGLKPKIFVMENVTGMIKGVMKGRFKEILATLKALPYQVKCKQMNAKYYDVPQSRERLIFIGVRNDLGMEPNYPVPSRKLITVKEAFETIVNHESELKESVIKETWQMYRVLNGKEKKKHFGLVRLEWNKPSNTIVKDAGNTSTGIIHPSENRKLTITEVKVLCSFPLDWKLFGNFHEKWARLGNAVMPKFMQAIAENIRINILDKYYKKYYTGQKAVKL
uniref:DNA (cytosine-5-)-methyltransferase n=1 Tax=viral metagenome TaxID=1070528 RepID=A0A6M3JKV9_9ZZZZ